MDLRVWGGCTTDPLRTGSAAVYAFVVFVGFADFDEFGARFGVDFPHFPTHFGGVGGEFCRWWWWWENEYGVCREVDSRALSW